MMTSLQVGSWKQVADKCCRGHYQPLLLMYMNANASSIDTSSAPQKTVMVPGHSFSNDPRTFTHPTFLLPPTLSDISRPVRLVQQSRVHSVYGGTSRVKLSPPSIPFIASTTYCLLRNTISAQLRRCPFKKCL